MLTGVVDPACVSSYFVFPFPAARLSSPLLLLPFCEHVDGALRVGYICICMHMCVERGKSKSGCVTCGVMGVQGLLVGLGSDGVHHHAGQSHHPDSQGPHGLNQITKSSVEHGGWGSGAQVYGVHLSTTTYTGVPRTG